MSGAQLSLLAQSGDRIVDGVRGLCARFAATASLREHLAIVDEAQVRTQIAWLRTHRKDQWEVLRPAIKASWDRGYPNPVAQRAQAKKVAQEMQQTWLKQQRKSPT
jgi:hypothetical protein